MDAEKNSWDITPAAHELFRKLAEIGHGQFVSRKEIGKMYGSADTATRILRSAIQYGYLEETDNPEAETKERGRPAKWYRINLLGDFESAVRHINTQYQRIILPAVLSRLARYGEPKVHTWTLNGEQVSSIALDFDASKNRRYLPRADSDIREQARRFLGDSKSAVHQRELLLRELALQQYAMDLAGYDRPRIFFVGSTIGTVPVQMLTGSLDALTNATGRGIAGHKDGKRVIYRSRGSNPPK